MASVASQMIEEVPAHTQSNSLEDAREICADGTYFPNNLRRSVFLCAVHFFGPILPNFLCIFYAIEHVARWKLWNFMFFSLNA